MSEDVLFLKILLEKMDDEKLESEQTALNQKALSLLKKLGITLRDLSPVYACEKCNDTGYVGTHRCDCFDKK